MLNGKFRGCAVRVLNATRDVVLGDQIEIADTSATRRTGLLKYTNLVEGQGLWIVPCEGVHTFGMKFPIDVLFLNRQRKVVKIRKEMARRRMAFCLTAHSVLELPAGAADRTGTIVGDQLKFER